MSGRAAAQRSCSTIKAIFQARRTFSAVRVINTHNSDRLPAAKMGNLQGRDAGKITKITVLIGVAIAVVFMLSSYLKETPRMMIQGVERSKPSIYGLTGKVRQLVRTREFGGRRTVADANPAECRPFSAKPGRKCDRWIVITTIYPVTDILKKIGSLKGWCTVVVGDKKGQASMDIPNVDYLNVTQQEGCGYQICKLIPWNHFGRKNIGFMYAIEHGAKLIYDTDDDNQPLQDVVPPLEPPYTQDISVSGNLWNPYPEFGPATDTWPRGFPLSRINDESTKKTMVSDRDASHRVGVVQYLAQHDPDVDAIFRMTRKLPFDFNTKPRQLVMPLGVLTPYNAQATLHSQDAFWGMLLPVTVHGRVTDIWRSYFTQRLLWDIGRHLAFHSPFVVQYRNAHNYLADFDGEMDLYTKTEILIKFLQNWKPDTTSSSLQQRLMDLEIMLYEYDFIDSDDVELTAAWIQDLQCLGYAFPKPSP